MGTCIHRLLSRSERTIPQECREFLRIEAGLHQNVSVWPLIERKLVSTSGASEIRWRPQDARLLTPVFEISGGSHVGRVRDVNEDSWLASPPVFLVADGMGGHAGGAVASALVVRAFEGISSRQVSVADVEVCVQRCIDDVNALAQDSPGAPGSTLVVLTYVVVDDEAKWLLANIGDSRAYGMKDGDLQQLSHDHSVVQELIDAGKIDTEEARSHPERHVITRAIGALEDTSPDYTLLDVVPGTRIMLCSDGVNGELDDASIGAILRGTSRATAAVEALIGSALSAGGHDNITAIVIDVHHADTEADADTLGGPVLSDADEDTVKLARRSSA